MKLIAPPIYRDKYDGIVLSQQTLNLLESWSTTPNYTILKVGDTYRQVSSKNPRLKGVRIKPYYTVLFVTCLETGHTKKLNIGILREEDKFNVEEETDIQSLPLLPQHNVCYHGISSLKQTCGSWQSLCWISPKQKYPFASLKGPDCVTWI